MEETMNLKPSQKRLVGSIACYLNNSGFSESFEKLLSEAGMEKGKLQSSSFPCLKDLHNNYPDAIELNFWILQYLKQFGFTDTYTIMISEANLQEHISKSNTFEAPDEFWKQFDDFLVFLNPVFKKKTNKKRKRSVEDEEENEDTISSKVMQNEEMTLAFKKITELLKTVQEHLIPMDGTKAGSLPNSKLADLLSAWNWTDVLFCWTIKRPRLICKPYLQTLDDCWAVSISRAQQYAVRLSKSVRPLLTPEKLRDGVSRKFQNDGRGLRLIDDIRSFMVGRYVDEMNIYSRPKEDYEGFESLIERLVTKCPVAVSFDIFPSYNSYKGRDVYMPKDMEYQQGYYENFQSHMVLVTGPGVQIKGGVMTEFWKYQDSRGKKWGQMGFGRLARGKGLINQVIELKVGKS